MAVAVEAAEEGSQDVADNAQKTLNGAGDELANTIDHDDNVGQDAEADEALDGAANSANDVDVVAAALGAVGDTVVAAATETDQASNVLDGLEDTAEETANATADSKAKTELVGVEEGNSIENALEVETTETGAGVLEVSADAGVDVNLDTDTDGKQILLDGLGGAESDGVEAGLAVSVLGVVLDNLGGGGSAESAELDLDGGVEVKVRLRPGTLDLGADAAALLVVPLHARLARASLGPGAVGHAGRAVELLGGAGLETSLGDGREAGGGGSQGGGRGGESDESSEELHVC